MSRLLVGDRWYERLAESALYEAEFESLLLARAETIYPGYHLVPFKILVQSDTSAARADLALIDEKYREWWVVEVEIASHPLAGHVLPQIATLATAYYGEDCADHLVNHNSALRKESLVEMTRGIQPRVLVIINAPKPEWVPSLRSHGAILQVVEVFRSDYNDHILRVNGEHPIAARQEILSLCALDPLMPRALVVHSPAAVPADSMGVVTIEYQGGITEWRRFGTKDRVWLDPVGRQPLQPKVDYVIVRDRGGSLQLREAGKEYQTDGS